MMSEDQTDPTGEMDSPAAQAGQTKPAIVQFVQDHPVAVIAGGLALGAFAAAMLPRRNREYVAEKSSALAEAVSAAGLMLYREALERAESASDGIRGFAGRLGGTGDAQADSANSEIETQDGEQVLRRAVARRLRQLLRK